MHGQAPVLSCHRSHPFCDATSPFPPYIVAAPRQRRLPGAMPPVAPKGREQWQWHPKKHGTMREDDLDMDVSTNGGLPIAGCFLFSEENPKNG